LNDSGIQSLIGNALKAHLQLLGEHIDNACIDRSPIHIHQTRVACRRIRAILKVFGDRMPEDNARNWNKLFRKLMNSFGRARDLDVQLQSLEVLTQEEISEDLRPALRRLKLRLSQRRESIQPKLISSVARFHESGMVPTLSRLADEWSHAVDTADQPALSGQVRIECKAQVDLLLDGLLTYVTVVDDPTDTIGHHDMRIAAKKLRYAMEIFLPAQTSEYVRFVKMVKKIQSHLGDVHDCDVWSDYLSDFLAKEAEHHHWFHGNMRGFSKVRQSLVRLSETKAVERKLKFEKFVSYWKKLESEGRITALQALLNQMAV